MDTRIHMICKSCKLLIHVGQTVGQAGGFANWTTDADFRQVSVFIASHIGHDILVVDDAEFGAMSGEMLGYQPADIGPALVIDFAEEK